MRNKIFDILMIILISAVSLALIYFDFFEKYSGFIMIPFLIFYYIGHYSGRKYNKELK
jgi:hypothetical protein